MLKPAFEIRLVKENLDLSMALWQAVQEQKVTAKQLFRDGPDDIVVAFAVDNDGPDQQELTRRAANQARAAFALSVIQVQRSLDRVFSGSPLEEENPDLQAARCVMFLLNNTISTIHLKSARRVFPCVEVRVCSWRSCCSSRYA